MDIITAMPAIRFMRDCRLSICAKYPCSQESTLASKKTLAWMKLMYAASSLGDSLSGLHTREHSNFVLENNHRGAWPPVETA